MRQLIDNGIDLNIRCDQGASGLFGAILQGNPIIIRIMLEDGANPNLWRMNQPQLYTRRSVGPGTASTLSMDWEKFHTVVKLLEDFGVTDNEKPVESDDDLKAVEARARAWQATKPFND